MLFDEPADAAEENIMKMTASITARTMMITWFAIPIAVMTESREKTISRSKIGSGPLQRRSPVAAGHDSLPSSLSWISRVAFANRKSLPR